MTAMHGRSLAARFPGLGGAGVGNVILFVPWGCEPLPSPHASGSSKVSWLATQRVPLHSSGHPLCGIVQAMYDAMNALLEGSPGGQLPRSASPQLMATQMRAAEVEQGARDFMDLRAADR